MTRVQYRRAFALVLRLGSRVRENHAEHDERDLTLQNAIAGLRHRLHFRPIDELLDEELQILIDLVDRFLKSLNAG